MTKTFDFVMYHNQQEFIPDAYFDDTVVRKSELTALWTINDQPVYSETFMHTNELIDETDLLQLGQTTVVSFETFGVGKSLTTGQSIWPTQENPGLYKFNSMWLELSNEHTIINRQTYSLLEMVGDIGGLFDGLLTIGHILLGPVAAYAMKAQLL